MMKRPAEPASEALSTVGLFLNVAAVLAFATGGAGLCDSATFAAVAAVALGAVLFTTSLICFAVGGRKLDAHRTAHVTSLDHSA